MTVFLGAARDAPGGPSNMGKDKPGTQSSQAKIDRYATQGSQGTPTSGNTATGAIGDNMATEILKAIQDSCAALEI